MLTCGEIMRPIQTGLYEDETVCTAVKFMLERHMGQVPIVDRQERFVGLLGGERIMHFMLPKHLTMVRGLERMSYLRESREELLERLDELCDKTIMEVADTRVKVVYPDTALIEAQHILSGSQFVVPVVDRESGKLLGAISFFTILAILRDEPSWSERVEQHINPEGESR